MTGHPKKLAIGVLGCSDISRRKFIPALLKTGSCHLAAVASRDPERGAAVAAYFSCEHLSYEKLIASPHLDLVYISLPNHLHEEWTIRALEAGKHVICEKPLALSPESVERMIRCAEKKGLLLYENIMFLHHPQHAAVKDIIVSGRIGSIKTLRCAFGFPYPQKDNFRMHPAAGGGAFHDMSRYPLATALYFLAGECNSFQGIAIFSKGLNCAMHGMSLSTAAELFTYSIAFGQQYESYYEIVGESGALKLNRAFTTPDHLQSRIEVRIGTDCTSVIVPPADHFQLMIEHVGSLVNKGGGFHDSHMRSREMARLAELMERGSFHAEIN